ncbi:hypothetical protein V9T40_014052 [Parthenolecanium corni]|uniref:Alpha-carbonic anhydrase domain-containing protein n=1 Tax=Parthenolecanium corni TaxID=536013 RepID=A0AAN9TFY0_9HEMI
MFAGPGFWGLINPDWSLCNKGRRQSPVNLEADKLLYDPNLRPFYVDKSRINGEIVNTGHSVNFIPESGNRFFINITGGPLSYKYQFQELQFHFGMQDKFGSEHTINGYSFPAELQLYGYNSQLYQNFSEAATRSQGLVAISLLVQLGDLSNAELRILTDQMEKLKYRGNKLQVRRLSIAELIPDTENYITYDGSTSMPACHETVTWLILNKPIYITKQQASTTSLLTD